MEHVSVEIERKYVIKKPSVEAMRACDGYSESKIVQTYLNSPATETRRVRSRALDGTVVYTETRKIRIDAMSSTEIEREITGEEYENLLLDSKADCRPIVKTRYTFIHLAQLFEVDVYPEWERSAIMETELDTRDREVVFPDFIDVVRDVTGVKSYSNASMSRSFPPEIVE